MKIEERPTEMLLRQLAANRGAARQRRHYAHQTPYRRRFVLEMIAMRAELRRRRVWLPTFFDRWTEMQELLS